MSKNKKNKAKLAQLLQQANKKETIKHIIKNNDQINSKIKQSSFCEDTNEITYIKKDLFKFYYTIVICLILLFSVWILNLKTDYINNLANSLSTISHINN